MLGVEIQSDKLNLGKNGVLPVVLPVLALASDPKVIRRMLLYRGVTPVQSDEIPKDDALVKRAEQEVLARGWAKAGEYVLVVAGEIWSGDDAGARILVHRVRSG